MIEMWEEKVCKIGDGSEARKNSIEIEIESSGGMKAIEVQEGGNEGRSISQCSLYHSLYPLLPHPAPPCIVLYCPGQPLSATPNTNISLGRNWLKASVVEKQSMTSIIRHHFASAGKIQTQKVYSCDIITFPSSCVTHPSFSGHNLMRSDLRVTSSPLETSLKTEEVDVW